MIKPTIGRIVWYHPGPNNSTIRLDTQPFAAIVTGVVDDHTVNLTAFDADGYSWPMRGIHLCQDDEQPEQYTAEWMPYQIGQAKKYEEGSSPVLDAKLAKIQEDQIELDRRLKLIESRPAAIDLRSPDSPNYNSQEAYGEPPRVIEPLKPGTPNLDAQKDQNEAKRLREANSLNITAPENQIQGKTPDGPVKSPPPPKAEPTKK